MLIDLLHQADMPPRLAYLLRSRQSNVAPMLFQAFPPYRRGSHSRSVGPEIALTGPIALGHANSCPLFLAKVLFSPFFR